MIKVLHSICHFGCVIYVKYTFYLFSIQSLLWSLSISHLGREINFETASAVKMPFLRESANKMG